MKIGIESQRIFRKGKHGMDIVALELIRQLQKLDRINEYILFAENGPDRGCITDTNNFRTEIIRGVTYAGWEQFALPSAVKKLKPDLLHCTANTAPLKCAVPLVLTIHDIIYLEQTNFKGSAYQNFGNIYRRIIVPHAIRKATSIITVSEYEKAVITDICGVDPDKITVIHNGVHNRFNPLSPGPMLDNFKNEYQLPKDFILFLGNTAPKKNTEGVIKAYVHYCLIEKDPLPIVITDYEAKAVKKILQEAGSPELMGNIHLPGYIPSEKMPFLYNCSTIFLYPSLRESFGLPVLESMACGIPVITSDIPAIREVAENAACFIDPGNHAGIAEVMQILLNDAEAMHSYKQKGLARASQFSWETSAKKLLEVYSRILG